MPDTASSGRVDFDLGAEVSPVSIFEKKMEGTLIGRRSAKFPKLNDTYIKFFSRRFFD